MYDYPKRRKMEKNSISLLQELCAKFKLNSPSYTVTRNGPLTFEYCVEACESQAIGDGTSKQTAKHKAAQSLLEQLKTKEKFCTFFTPFVTTAKNGSIERNFVGELLELCIQIGVTVPSFIHDGQAGQPHMPQFSMRCLYEEFRCQAFGSTKKCAKQLVAKEMLMKIREKMDESNNDSGVSVDVEKYEVTVDDIINAYRKHYKLRSKNMMDDLLNNRHFAIECRSEEKRTEIREIFNRNLTDRETVDLLCKTINLEYKFYPIREYFPMKCFELIGDYDCVIINCETELWKNVVDYFRLMLWI